VNASFLFKLAAGLLCWSLLTVVVSVALSLMLCQRAMARSHAESRTQRFHEMVAALRAQARAPDDTERKERGSKLRLFRLWQQQSGESADTPTDPWRESPARTWPDESHGDLPDAGKRHVE
jgi:hypothetical protein